MELEAFATLVIPFIIVVYLGFLLFTRPPKTVLVASLLGGLTGGLINALYDLLAYYAQWWHYTLDGLILHLPIPFYITPILIYGSIVYLLAWRYWHGRGHWAVVLPARTPVILNLRAFSRGLWMSECGCWRSMPASWYLDARPWRK